MGAVPNSDDPPPPARHTHTHTDTRCPRGLLCVAPQLAAAKQLDILKLLETPLGKVAAVAMASGHLIATPPTLLPSPARPERPARCAAAP